MVHHKVLFLGSSFFSSCLGSCFFSSVLAGQSAGHVAFVSWASQLPLLLQVSCAVKLQSNEDDALMARHASITPDHIPASLSAIAVSLRRFLTFKAVSKLASADISIDVTLEATAVAMDVPLYDLYAPVRTVE